MGLGWSRATNNDSDDPSTTQTSDLDDSKERQPNDHNDVVYAQEMYKLSYSRRTHPRRPVWSLKRVKIIMDKRHDERGNPREVPLLVYRTLRDQRSIGPVKTIDLSQVTRIGRCPPSFEGQSYRNKFGMIEIVSPERVWLFAPYLPQHDATTRSNVERVNDGVHPSYEYETERKRFIDLCKEVARGRSVSPDKHGSLNLLVRRRDPDMTWEQRYCLVANGRLFVFRSKDDCRTFIGSLYLSQPEFESELRRLVLQNFELEQTTAEKIHGKFSGRHRFVFHIFHRGDETDGIYLQGAYSSVVDEWLQACARHGAAYD